MSRIIDLDACGQMGWAKQKENNTTILVTSASEFMAICDGSPVAVFKRHEGAAYVHECSLAGNQIFLTLYQNDTKYAGKCQVTFYWKNSNSSVCSKSKTFFGFIEPDAAAGADSSDDIQKLIDRAEELFDKVSAIQGIIFCNELPLVGEPNKLYVLPGEEGVYTWENNTWVIKEANDSEIHYWKNM